MKSCAIFFSLSLFFSGCKTGGKDFSTKEKSLPVPVLSESMLQKQLNGVDFFARGNKPASWTLEMDFGNLIRFKSLDGTEVNSTAVQPIALPDKKGSSYTSKTSNGAIEITVYNETCSDGLSGEQYNKKVIVKLNNRQYEGCGQYLFDASLNGKWILLKINNRNLQASDFAKGLPEIDLQLSAGKVSGHDGCNNIMGNFEVLGSKIKFTTLAGTKMACPSNTKENDFVHLLSDQTIDYYFTDGQLYFYLPDDSIIIFKRA